MGNKHQKALKETTEATPQTDCLFFQLPLDILTEILRGLPGSTLLRLACTCKILCELIRSHEVVWKHLVDREFRISRAVANYHREKPISLLRPTLLTQHLSQIESVTISSDSTIIASISKESKIKVHQKNNSGHYKFVQNIPTSSWNLTIDISPNTKKLAFGGFINEVEVVNTKKSDKVITLSGHGAYIANIHFFSNDRLISASGDESCKLWDIEKKSPITTFTNQLQTQQNLDLDCLWVRVSQDQSFGIGASANRAFQFDLRTGKTENVFEAGPSLVNCVCIATEQTEFASVNDCGVLKIWDLRTGKMRCKSEPVKGQAMRCVVASPSFRYFYVSGEHDMLCFEDNAKLIEQSPNKIQCIAIDQEGKTVVGASIKDLLGFQQ